VKLTSCDAARSLAVPNMLFYRDEVKRIPAPPPTESAVNHRPIEWCLRNQGGNCAAHFLNVSKSRKHSLIRDFVSNIELSILPTSFFAKTNHCYTTAQHRYTTVRNPFCLPVTCPQYPAIDCWKSIRSKTKGGMLCDELF
jgi:hypothetical protein